MFSSEGLDKDVALLSLFQTFHSLANKTQLTYKGAQFQWFGENAFNVELLFKGRYFTPTARKVGGTIVCCLRFIRHNGNLCDYLVLESWDQSEVIGFWG